MIQEKSPRNSPEKKITLGWLFRGISSTSEICRERRETTEKHVPERSPKPKCRKVQNSQRKMWAVQVSYLRLYVRGWSTGNMEGQAGPGHGVPTMSSKSWSRHHATGYHRTIKPKSKGKLFWTVCLVDLESQDAAGIAQGENYTDFK